MLKFLLSIEEELGDGVADMTACSTGENLLRKPSSNDGADLEVGVGGQIRGSGDGSNHTVPSGVQERSPGRRSGGLQLLGDRVPQKLQHLKNTQPEI